MTSQKVNKTPLQPTLSFNLRNTGEWKRKKLRSSVKLIEIQRLRPQLGLLVLGF